MISLIFRIHITTSTKILKNLTLLVIIFLSFNSSAQENEVEIRVQDTLYFDQCNTDSYQFIDYYKTINFNSNDYINKYLKASFLGDDFIISNYFKNKYSLVNGRSYINPLIYGFQADALHKNNEFGSNMGSYKYLNDNKKILDTFYNKIKLNREIRKNFIS